jgi:hypothetical protein
MNNWRAEILTAGEARARTISRICDERATKPAAKRPSESVHVILGSSRISWGKSIGRDGDRGRAYSQGPCESVTRGDRRGRERWLEGSAPPLAGPCESDGGSWLLPHEIGPIRPHHGGSGHWRLDLLHANGVRAYQPRATALGKPSRNPNPPCKGGSRGLSAQVKTHPCDPRGAGRAACALSGRRSLVKGRLSQGVTLG